MTSLINFPTNRPIFSELHNIFNILRQLVHDNRPLYDSIDESYEEILLSDLVLVPEQFDKLTMNIIKTIKVIFTSVDYINMAKNIDEEMAQFLHFKLDTFQEFKNGLSYIKLSRQDRARVNNIVVKFEPLFRCVDSMLDKPLEYIRKAAAMTSDQYNNIF